MTGCSPPDETPKKNLSGEWLVLQSIDRMDDSEKISILLTSDAGSITVRNYEEERMELYFKPKSSPRIRRDEVNLTIRFDSNDAIKIKGNASKDRDAVFLPWWKVNSVLREMLQSETMLIQFESYESSRDIVKFDVRGLNTAAQPLFNKMEWNYSSDSDLLKDTVNNLKHDKFKTYDIDVRNQTIIVPVSPSAYKEYYKKSGVSEKIQHGIKFAIDIASDLYPNLKLDILVVGDSDNTPDSLTDQQLLLKVEAALESGYFDKNLINKITTTQRPPELYTAETAENHPVLIGVVRDHANVLEISIAADTPEIDLE